MQSKSLSGACRTESYRRRRALREQRFFSTREVLRLRIHKNANAALRMTAYALRMTSEFAEAAIFQPGRVSTPVRKPGEPPLGMTNRKRLSGSQPHAQAGHEGSGPDEKSGQANSKVKSFLE